MPIQQHTDSARTIETLAWFWLWGGVVCLLCVPAARDYSLAIGWSAYWLVGAPLSWLVYATWPRWAARLRAFLVRSSESRRYGDRTVPGRHRNRRQGRRILSGAASRNTRPAHDAGVVRARRSG